MSNEVATLPAKRQDLFTLSPRNLDEAMRYAEIISKTDMVPKDFQGKPGNVLLAVQMGAEVGLPPTQALQNIAVINGRPAIWGDAVLAIVKARADLEYIDESWDENETATCRIKRRGQPEVVRSFSIEDSKKAGLAGKSGPWTQYPKRMRQMRARSWAIRDCYPDALKGIAVAEEAIDAPVEREINPLPDAADTKPKSRTEAVREKVAKARKKTEAEAEAETTAGAPEGFAAISAAIDEASSLEALSDAVTNVASLSDDEKRKARIGYKLRQAQLSGINADLTQGENGATLIVNIDTGETIAEIR